MRTLEIKVLELVDDIAYLNCGLENAAKSYKIIAAKVYHFLLKKCDILSTVSRTFSSTISVKGEDHNIDIQFKYLGDIFNIRGDNATMIKDRVGKAVDTTNETNFFL